MQTHQFQEFSIELLFDKRGNHYHVHSPNVAGLHLAGADLSAIKHDIEPAVRDLLRFNSNISVDTIRWIPSFDAVAKEFEAQAADEGKATYVITLKGAA